MIFKEFLRLLIVLLFRFTVAQLFLVACIQRLYASGELDLRHFNEFGTMAYLFLFLSIIIPHKQKLDSEELKRANDLKEKELEIQKENLDILNKYYTASKK